MRFDNRVLYQNLGGCYVFKEIINEFYFDHTHDRYFSRMREVHPNR